MEGKSLRIMILELSQRTERVDTFSQLFYDYFIARDRTIAENQANIRFIGHICQQILVDKVESIEIKEPEDQNFALKINYEVILSGHNIFSPQTWSSNGEVYNDLEKIHLSLFPERYAFIKVDDFDKSLPYVIYTGQNFGTSENSVWRMKSLYNDSRPFIVDNLEESNDLIKEAALYCKQNNLEWRNIILKTQTIYQIDKMGFKELKPKGNQNILPMNIESLKSEIAVRLARPA